MRGLGNPNRVQRADEEEVEEERGAESGDQGWPDSAHQRHDDNEELIGEHIARDRIRAPQKDEWPGDQRQPDDRQQKADHPPSQRQRPADCRQSTLARLSMRHDVHVDVAGQSNYAGPDPSAAEQ